MIGLVIVAHDGLAEALAAGMQHVVGPQDGVVAIAIGPQDDLRHRQNEIASAVASVDAGAGVVLEPATDQDMRGSKSAETPSLEVVYDEA